MVLEPPRVAEKSKSTAAAPSATVNVRDADPSSMNPPLPVIVALAVCALVVTFPLRITEPAPTGRLRARVRVGGTPRVGDGSAGLEALVSPPTFIPAFSAFHVCALKRTMLLLIVWRLVLEFVMPPRSVNALPPMTNAPAPE